MNIKRITNPVTDNLYINTDASIKEIRIQNVLGQTVMQLNGYTEKGIDVQSIRAGNYILIVRSADNKIYTGKFIKM